jgi:tRNA dimethylallyltransferase
LEDADTPIPVIVGPTASGKSAVAMALAELVPMEIVSADSRQVYRGLDVGTAKPTAADRALVRHHGIDLIMPFQRFSAGQFAEESPSWIASIRSRDRLPVVVGGTGLYVRALFEGFFDEPELPASRREALGAVLAGMPLQELQRWAGRLDRGFRGDGGTHRAARAVEVALLSGQPLSVHQHARATPAAAQPFYVLLTVPREELHRRIDARARAMIAGGLLDEVRAAWTAQIRADAPGLRTIGYAEAIRHLRGELTEAQMIEQIVVATRQYAKRQETWFRHQLSGPVMTLDATQPPDVLAHALISGYRATLKTG